MFDHSTVKAYRQILHPSSIALDIGANIGAHTLHMAKFVGPEGKVISFEPTKFAFDKLQANIQDNPLLAKRIEAYQIMLVDRNDASPEKELYSSWPLRDDKNCHVKHCGRMRSTQGVNAVTLDRFSEANKIENIHLIKIDVDGAECSVIRGALGAIRRDKPVLIMELCPYVLEERGSSIEELLDLLSGEGYELKEIVSRKPNSSDSRSLRKQIPDGASINVEAWPKSKR